METKITSHVCDNRALIFHHADDERTSLTSDTKNLIHNSNFISFIHICLSPSYVEVCYLRLKPTQIYTILSTDNNIIFPRFIRHAKASSLLKSKERIWNKPKLPYKYKTPRARTFHFCISNYIRAPSYCQRQLWLLRVEHKGSFLKTLFLIYTVCGNDAGKFSSLETTRNTNRLCAYIWLCVYVL